MANFFIQIDKPFYFAGDTVNGNILVNVVQPLPATGISLKFTGYECVKWNSSSEIVRPRPVQGQPPPPDPIAAIPPHLIYNKDNFDVSDIESADNNEYDHRPQYIRTSAGRVYKMSYFETRNVFTTIKTMVYSCNGMAPGQYSFPISFKTFEGWPASFDYRTPRKKGRIIYHMTAAVEPGSGKFQLQHAVEITMRQTKVLQAATKSSTAQITSCCCIDKGTSAINVHFQKDGYMPGQDVRMIIEVDNTNCSVPIESINMNVTNTVGLRSAQSSTADTHHVFGKRVPGLPAGTKMVGNEAIKEGFKLLTNSQLKPTCSGKLLSSHFDLSISLGYDVACDCCSSVPVVSLRIMIFPSIRSYQLPTTFTQNWAPKMMPMCNFTLPNTFENFNLSAMMNQPIDYPPPPPPPGLVNQMNNGMNNGMNQMNNQINAMNNGMNTMGNQMNNNMMNMNNQMNNNMMNMNNQMNMGMNNGMEMTDMNMNGGGFGPSY